MDWKRVKTILISLLLVTNLILGYSVYGQFRSVSRSEAKALERALALSGGGSGLTAAMVGSLPAEPQSYAVPRDSVCETAFALALLGEAGFEMGNSGGGIVHYSSQRGSGEIKSGGEMEFTLTVQWEPGRLEAELDTLLRDAGITMDGGDMAPGPGGTVVCAQRWNGLPLDRYVLQATLEVGVLRLSGRWLLCREPVPEERAPRISELVLYLAPWAEGGGHGPILGLEAGYHVADSRVRPVWLVHTEDGMRIFDLIDRRIVR